MGPDEVRDMPLLVRGKAGELAPAEGESNHPPPSLPRPRGLSRPRAGRRGARECVQGGARGRGRGQAPGRAVAGRSEALGGELALGALLELRLRHCRVHVVHVLRTKRHAVGVGMRTKRPAVGAGRGGASLRRLRRPRACGCAPGRGARRGAAGRACQAKVRRNSMTSTRPSARGVASARSATATRRSFLRTMSVLLTERLPAQRFSAPWKI